MTWDSPKRESFKKQREFLGTKFWKKEWEELLVLAIENHKLYFDIP